MGSFKTRVMITVPHKWNDCLSFVVWGFNEWKFIQCIKVHAPISLSPFSHLRSLALSLFSSLSPTSLSAYFSQGPHPHIQLPSCEGYGAQLGALNLECHFFA